MPSPIIAALMLVCASAAVSASEPFAMMARQDADFVRKAAAACLIEVGSSEAAIKRGWLSSEERRFAEQLASDRRSMLRELASLAGARGMVVAKDPDKDARERLQMLSDAKDEQAAGCYLACVLKDHQDAIALYEEEGRLGTDAELKGFAGKHLRRLRLRLEAARILEIKH